MFSLRVRGSKVDGALIGLGWQTTGQIQPVVELYEDPGLRTVFMCSKGLRIHTKLYVPQRRKGPQNLKHLLPDPLPKTFASPCSRPRNTSGALSSAILRKLG